MRSSPIRIISLLASAFGFNSGAPAKFSISKGATPGFSPFALPSYPFLPGFRQSADSKAFGQSETCRRMRRKNKLRALGIAGSRI